MGPDTSSTLWQLVRVAGEAHHPRRRDAMGRLIKDHWTPVYHFFRRSGLSADDAPDLTQAFFTHMLESDGFSKADPARGRFRGFLRTCARNFMLHERERAGAAKRGGDARTLSLDFDEAERLLEPASDDTPDHAYDRQWALGLIQAAIAQLEAECATDGRRALFDAVRAAFRIDGPPESPTHARIAGELGVAEQDVANFLFRARKRLREVLRDRVAATVDSASEVDEEIRDLFAAIR